MIRMRPSVPGDVPRQRELWKLAFGDDGAYVDNFYHNYYRPERVLVLEEDGVVQAMTAWFDTSLALPGGRSCRAGYLYAVATHPDARGKGYAGALLRYADTYLKEEQGCQAVTTVPAEDSLHRFFAAQGFRECFTHDELTLSPGETAPADGALEPLTPRRYGQLREALLADVPHVSYPEEALAYQLGCCRASGGGLYLAGGHSDVVLCAEGMADGGLLVKEILGAPEARAQVLAGLFHTLPGFCGRFRAPGGGKKFGMLKWLDPGLAKCWNWDFTVYMGLAFD